MASENAMQSVITTDNHKKNLSRNTEMEIASFSDKTFSKKYKNLMKELIQNKDYTNKLRKTNNKLISFFQSHEKNSINKSPTETEAASMYQLGHYYAFGFFDPYFKDELPSHIKRENASPINTDKALYYLNYTPIAQGYLRLIPNTWLTDYLKGLGMACLDVRINHKEAAEFLSDINDFNFFRAGLYATDYEVFGNSGVVKKVSIYGIINLLKILSELPANHPCKIQLLSHFDTDKIVNIALSYAKKERLYETLYYSSMAALRGNVNGILLLINEYFKAEKKQVLKYHPIEIEAGLFHQECITELMTLNLIFKEAGCKYEDVLFKIIDYYSETSDAYNKEFNAKIEAKKKERRRNMWKNIGIAVLNTLNNINIPTKTTSTSFPYKTTVGDFSSLIDPNVAISKAIDQINEEYLNFCKHFKKYDGTDYTFNEWLALCGQQHIGNNIPNGTISTSSTQKTNTSSTQKVCTTCNGTGRMPKDTNPAQFGYDNSYKVKCNECGQYFPKSWGHTHVTCTSCHGKGYYGL